MSAKKAAVTVVQSPVEDRLHRLEALVLDLVKKTAAADLLERIEDLEARMVAAEAMAHRAAIHAMPIGGQPGPHETVIPRVEAHVRDVPPQVRSSLRGMD